MSDERVELRPAHAWDCPACGARDNFVACVAAELTDTEAAELRKMMGADDEGEEWKPEQTPAEFIDEVGLVTHPNTVTCAKCGESFPTVEPDGQMPPDFNPHKDLA